MLFRGCVLDIGLPNRELYEMFFKKCDHSTTFDCKKKKSSVDYLMRRLL